MNRRETYEWPLWMIKSAEKLRRLIGFPVALLGNGSQQLVSVAFFLNGLVQESCLLCFAKNLSPPSNRSIRCNFIMFHALRGGDQGNVADRGICCIFNQVLGFSYQGRQGFAFNCVG